MSTITAPRQNKLATILPHGPKKILVDEQWLLAMRRFVRKAVDHGERIVTELEVKHPPIIKHAKGCRAVSDDAALCLPKCPDRELRATVTCIRALLHDLLDQAPIRKFGADEEYHFPTRDGYMALVVEVEYLRDKLAELEPDGAPRLGAPEIVAPAAETASEDPGPAPETHSLPEATGEAAT